ncbi:MAG: NUDIX hydrolase [Bacilli bacterium]|nr:NUDIX hydrolase [Bacilli bacterium]
MENNEQVKIYVYSKPIYIFDGYYDSREDEYGPCFGDEDDYKKAIYYSPYKWSYSFKIPKKEMNSFEKDKIIIKNKKYVDIDEAKRICREELDNSNNKSEEDLIESINKRIEKYNFIHSPKYREKLLLDRINNLYYKVKGSYINKEVLYNGRFLEIIKEVYELPNGKKLEKEKIVKNKGKNSVIIIPQVYSRNMYNDYILTFQTRVTEQLLAEFPAGYIEENETPLEAAKRELLEETGYTSNDMVILDEAYSSPGIDNSKTYIVLAENCQKISDPTGKGTELLSFGVFTRHELDYLVNTNIINGAMNKLAYCKLITDQPGNRTKKLEL